MRQPRAACVRAGSVPVGEYGLLLLLALLWGSSYLLIKLAVAEIPPATLIAVRVTLAALLLLALMRWQGHRLPRDARSWRWLLLQAFLNSIGAWTLLAWGQQFVESGLASVLNSTSPIFVYLVASCLLRQEPVAPDAAGGCRDRGGRRGAHRRH